MGVDQVNVPDPLRCSRDRGSTNNLELFVINLLEKSVEVKRMLSCNLFPSTRLNKMYAPVLATAVFFTNLEFVANSCAHLRKN